MGDELGQADARPMPPDMLEPVAVRCVVVFGFGDKVVQVGEVVTVSHARANYLRFLGLVEWL